MGLRQNPMCLCHKGRLQGAVSQHLLTWPQLSPALGRGFTNEERARASSNPCWLPRAPLPLPLQGASPFFLTSRDNRELLRGRQGQPFPPHQPQQNPNRGVLG